MIKDCIFSLKNAPEDLIELIRNDSTDVTPACTAGVCCNYINGTYINITGISDFNNLKLNEKYSLNEIINKFKPGSLFEIALCMKLYNNLIFNYCDHIESEKENYFETIVSGKLNQLDKYKEINSLLKDSRGWIVWRYQIFNILSLAVYESEKINFYIKGLNTKKTEIIEELKYLKINDFSVYEIIKELSLPTSFMAYAYPNLRDSQIINNEMKLF